MAARVILDTVQDSELDATAVTRDRIRTGMIVGMDVPSNVPDPILHEKALIVLIAAGLDWGSILDPSVPDCFLTRIRLIPVSSRNFRFAAYYSTFRGGVPTIYNIRQSAQEEQYTGNLLPGTRIPIRAEWTGTIAGVAVDIKRYVTTQFSRPLRSIALTASFFGDLPNDLPIFSNVPRVNNAVWLGLPAGYWKMTRVETDYSKFSGYYTTEAIALTRTDEDWSQYEILQNAFGEYVDVDDGDIEALNAKKYGYDNSGPLLLPGYAYANGIVRIYPFLTADFGAIFGFTS